ncbi:MAG: YraN family protein [Bacteroidota bacterium]
MSNKRSSDPLKNKTTAAMGENMACERLQRQGWHILHRNWRSSPYEVDIIATLGPVLAFVEVKSSRSHRHAEPARQVKYHKFLNLSKAAYRYLQEFPHRGEIRFDLMECRWQKNGIVDCLHWEDFWQPDNLGLLSPNLDSFWRNTGRMDSAP